MIERIRRANAIRLPEHSKSLRLCVFFAVEFSALSLVIENAVSYSTGVIVLALLPFAYLVSYQRRTADNWHIKIVLAGAALFALARFFVQMGQIATLDEARFPLAEVFLWVQVLHSFDLPARKDLYFSLGASLALIAVAGSISQDLSFALALIPYLTYAFAALVLGHRSEAFEGAGAVLRSSRRGWAGVWRASRPLLTAGGTTVLAAVVLFLVIPQPASARSFALPFSLGSGGSSAGGALVNPGFSEEPSSRSSGASYYGVSNRMDLRVRGDLSDDLVMRVRSSAAAMWKGALFDTYDGRAWTGDLSDPVPLAGEPPYSYPIAFRGLGPRAVLTQTYYIERELPNAVFAAGQPDEVWFDGAVSIDELGALRTPATLTKGTVYSVVSSRGAATARQLRSLPREVAPAHLERYLQLPSALPDRVGELARRVTRGLNNDYDRVLAIEDYLRAHYRYTLDSPIPPPGRDAVDHFLFDAKVGFCEQFASATAVMLRSLGIPSRVVTGYAVGRRNVFTGLYDVRASDAHAWVEAWFPSVGWYEFDPTYAVPPAHGSLGDVMPLAKVVRFIAGKIGSVAGDGSAVLQVGFVLAATAAAMWAGVVVRGKLRRRDRAPGVRSPEDLGPVAAAFERVEHALAARGRARGAPETAREFVARSADLQRAGIRAALEAFERERYGAEPPPRDAARSAVRELDRIAQALGTSERTTSPPP